MVTIQPFKVIRPTKALARQVATLPYDVLNSAEARVLGDKNPYSYLHIDKAEIDLPQSISPYDDQVYKKWLIQDDVPALYLYELTMDGRYQTGIVTCTAIDDYLNGTIKKLEFTRPEKEHDRIRHSDACDANTSPIFLTYRNHEPIQSLTEQCKRTHAPLYDFASFHDVHHRVWIVDDSTIIDQLVTLFEREVPSLYIADGHHRTESAVKVGQKKRATLAHPTNNHEIDSFLSIIFPKEELSILDYNRVLHVTIPTDFLARLENWFTFQKTTTGKPTAPKTFGMYLDHQWYTLKAKDSIHSTDAVAGLDVSLLQTYIFTEIFDIQDVRTDQRIDFVGGIRGLQELERLVDSEQEPWNLAFAVYPASMDDLLQVADAGEIMPPKSTWFEPKLLSGLFIHDLETES